MKDNVVWENYWANYMAMDSNGSWWEFDDMPLVKDSFWGQENYLRAKEKKRIPKHKPYWKESLIKRERNTEMNPKIKIMRLYETMDGSHFRDLKEAEEHERLLNLVDFIYDEGYNGIMNDHNELKKFIMRNKYELRKILFN